jgi:hypothetical protein
MLYLNALLECCSSSTKIAMSCIATVIVVTIFVEKYFAFKKDSGSQKPIIIYWTLNLFSVATQGHLAQVLLLQGWPYPDPRVQRLLRPHSSRRHPPRRVFRRLPLQRPSQHLLHV